MLLNGISSITSSGFSACICAASLTSQLGHHQLSCGTVMAPPWITQVLAFWSNSDQKGVVRANTMMIRSTERTLSTASSECLPRARSSCIDTPVPPNAIRAPSARHALITKWKSSDQNGSDTPAQEWRAQDTSIAVATTTPAMATASPSSEEHTSELQSLMRTSYDVFCLQKNKKR